MNNDLFKASAFTLILISVIITVAYQFVDPAPPSTIRIATGSEQGAYHLFAKHYANFLAKEKIKLEIVSTKGSIENIQLLQNGDVDIAFVQSGTKDEDDDDELETLQSLGSLYFEPLWIFYRHENSVNRLKHFTGQRISIGQPGSGTNAVMSKLLAENNITPENTEWHSLDNQNAINALKDARLDMAAFVASPEAPFIKELLAHPDIQLMSLQRAKAYSRLYRFLSNLELPEGALDIANNLPVKNTQLLAPTANLVVNENMHPALINLILQAADHEHENGGIFENIDQFPAAVYLEYKLHNEARRFYKHGPPFLQRYLPFWAASLIDRLKFMLLPLVALLIPLFKLMPPLYRWRMRSRIYRWYRELETIDVSADNNQQTNTRELAEELDRIEQEVIRVSVPLSYAVELYDLRVHLALVRQQLDKDRNNNNE